MIPIIGEVIGNLFGLGRDYLDGKRKLKQAKLETELYIEKSKATADIDWDKQALVNAQTSWKDEWFTLLLSIPAIMAFIPGLAPYVGFGFAELAKAPDWYLAAFGIAVAALFGFRKFGNKLIDKAK